MMRPARSIAALMVSVALLSSSPAFAQSDAETIAQLKAQVEALTRRVSQLERAPASVVPPPAATTPTSADGAEHKIATTEAAPPPQVRASAPVPSVPPAPIDRPLQPVGSAFQLSASGDSNEVAIRLGTTLSKPNLNGGARGTATYDSLSLTASAPIDKKNSRTDLGTLDGFANSSMLKVRWTRFAIPIANPAADPVAEARENQIIETARVACRAKAEGKGDALKACNDDDVDAVFVATHDPGELAEFQQLGFPHAPSFAYGLEGSIGYKKFSFFDPATLAEQSEEKTPIGAKVFLTWFPDTSLTAITGSFAYTRSFEEQKTATLCPIQATGPVRCVTGPIGDPKRKTGILGALELRKQWLLKGFLIPSIGIAPQVTYDFEGDKGGLDFPIYVIPDAKGNLLGGVRFGYRTDTKDLAIGVFVGSAFSFHP